MMSKRLVCVPALLMVATLASQGCGREDPAPAATTAAPAVADKNQVNPRPRDQMQDGGKFTWPISALPSNFNRAQLDGTEKDTAEIMSALMPAAFHTDAVGTPLWNDDYLAAAPTMTPEPKQVVTYQINPKAAWDDGTPLTWEDFHWQWKANNGSDKRYQISSANGYEDIENVQRGKDDREVIVTFKHKYADWPAIFDPIYPSATNKNPAIFNDGWKAQPLVTAGPFRFGSLDRTSKTVTLVRNEKWWGDRAKLDSIVYRMIEPDAQIDALANGEIDAMDVGPDANKYARARTIDAAEVRVAGGPNFRHLTVNGTGAILQDVKVRQALAMAIDRTAIAKALLGPLGIDPRPLNNHIFMANQAGYQDNSGDVGKYNPARARQLLDEAGWTLNGTSRMKGGKPLEIICTIPAGVATSRQESELIQNMLAQVGATLTINTVPTPDLFSKYVTPGQFDFTVFSWIGTPYPISASKSLYVKPVRNARGELEVQQNYARVGSDEIDQLFQQAFQELDRTKATEIANRIDGLIWQEVHSLTLYQRPELVVAKKTLANFGAFGFASWKYEDIGWVK